MFDASEFSDYSKSDVPLQIIVRTDPPDLFQRFTMYSTVFREFMRSAMEEALNVVQGKIPPYPPKPPTSWYERTGNLGRSFGKSMDGRTIGQADIHTIKIMGNDSASGRIGSSSVHYNRRVVGDRQDFPWAGYWWNVTQVANIAFEDIVKVYEKWAERVTKFLDGKL